MLNNLFTGIFDTAGAAVISVPDFLLCIVVSLLIGAFITWVYTYKNRYTTSFAVTLAMLPAIVCIVIMMVNGNVGAGVAVAGAFSLVRFRSVPSPSEGLSIFYIAVAYQKMHMCMCCICMHCKQYFISFWPEELPRKIFCYFICLLIGQSVIILRVEGYWKLLCQYLLLLISAVLFVMHLSCHKQAVCKVIPVTAESFIQVWFCLYHTIFHLFFSSAQNQYHPSNGWFAQRL